jgi:16S rRNA (cytidine1402-2'-O)-methyltransferase
VSSTSTKSEDGAGRLSVVATPIGNLEDITLRAIRVLRECDRVLAEDTRHSKALLSHHGIGTRLSSLHAHTTESKLASLVDELAAGAWFALVSDAGTPLVSDPGAELVARTVARGVRVEPVPGPSAVAAALAVAFIPWSSFRFAGFLPRKGASRREALARIAADESATVLFEAPTRLAGTLNDLAEIVGDRRVAICRELTKLHEEIRRGEARSLLDALGGTVRGKITLVIEGRSGDASTLDEPGIDRRIDALLDDGTPTRDAAKIVATDSALSRGEAYRRVLARQRAREPRDDD